MPDRRDTAMELMQTGAFLEALDLFGPLADEQPDDWSIQMMMGQCCRYSGMHEEAVAHLERADSMNPGWPPLLLALGIALQSAGRLHEAIQALEAAVGADPHLHEAHNSLGVTYRMCGRSAEALACYERAAEVVINGHAARLMQSHSQPAERDGKRVLEVDERLFGQLHAALRSTPTYATIKNNMGRCLLESGDLGGARASFAEAIDCTPDGYEYPHPHAGLADVAEVERRLRENEAPS